MPYKGLFTPNNPDKYRGDHTNIIYRSLWEKRFMRYCDENPNVLAWSSEELSIPYLSPVDKKMHRYFPDFLVNYRNKRGQTETRLIEIKPKNQTIPPKKKTTKRGKPTVSFLREASRYAINDAKWKAAQEFCADRKWVFSILTEDELGL